MIRFFYKLNNGTSATQLRGPAGPSSRDTTVLHLRAGTCFKHDKNMGVGARQPFYKIFQYKFVSGKTAQKNKYLLKVGFLSRRVAG